MASAVPSDPSATGNVTAGATLGLLSHCNQCLARAEPGAGVLKERLLSIVAFPLVPMRFPTLQRGGMGRVEKTL